MLCHSLIKLGEGGRISGREEVQLWPEMARFAKDIWTMKCWRCNEVMLQARGDLEKLIRNAGDGTSGLWLLWRKSEVQADRWSKQRRPLCFSFLWCEDLWWLRSSWCEVGEQELWWGARTQRLMLVPFPGLLTPGLYFVCLFVIFTVGPSVESLLLVSSDPSASFLCYFVFCI